MRGRIACATAACRRAMRIRYVCLGKVGILRFQLGILRFQLSPQFREPAFRRDLLSALLARRRRPLDLSLHKPCRNIERARHLLLIIVVLGDVILKGVELIEIQDVGWLVICFRCRSDGLL